MGSFEIKKKIENGDDDEIEEDDGGAGFRFEMKKKIEDVEDDGMKKKIKKKTMKKKINTNFQKGHKTYRDFQKDQILERQNCPFSQS